jgi:hypothetical protein
MRHKDCKGHFIQWQIPEHHFCFMMCDWCNQVLGGEKVEHEIRRLMRTKVRPTMRRA